jgi:acyl carrier protein
MTEQEKINFLEAAILKLFDKKVTLSIDDNLLEVGIDSLDAVELQLYYEEELKIEINDSTTTIATVRDLINLM